MKNEPSMAIRAAGTYVSKGRASKKGGKSRQKEDKFGKKKFFNLVTQPVFPVTLHGRTSHTKSRPRQDLTPYLVGRTFNVNQGDLTNENKDTFRNFSFKVGEVRGHDCVSYFNGMYVAKDKLAGLVRKWHTLITAHVDVETKDGSTWRFFVEAVTKRTPGNTKKTVYAKSSQVKAMRQIMFETIKEEVDGQDVEKIMKKLSTEAIAKEIETRCAEICNINAIIKKVKPIKNMKIIELSRKVNFSGAENDVEEVNEFEIVGEN